MHHTSADEVRRGSVCGRNSGGGDAVRGCAGGGRGPEGGAKSCGGAGVEWTEAGVPRERFAPQWQLRTVARRTLHSC